MFCLHFRCFYCSQFFLFALYRLPSLSPQQAKATSGSVSTLKNGLIVVTEDASSLSTVTLTYPKAGSAYEMMNEQGAALTNKCMNFRSGSGLSTLLINRTIEDEGGTPFTSVTRVAATVGFTVAKEKAVSLVPLLATDCTFEKWDVRDAKALATKESSAAKESAQIVLTESLYAAAYGPQSPAGRPLYGATCDTETLKAFRHRAYGLNGAILTATGVVDHSAFCTEVETLLAESPVGTGNDAGPSMTYQGGETRIATPGTGYAHVAVAFQGPQSSVLASVVAQFLGLAGAEAGVSPFVTSGLLGLYARSNAPAGITDSIAATLKTTVSPDAIQRAKVLAKAEAFFALDGGSKSLANFMASSVIESGSFTNGTNDAVTEKDVKDALAAMYKSNPALAAVGDISAVPYHATFAANLK
jgi:predicted Zn-dependent peptidase